MECFGCHGPKCRCKGCVKRDELTHLRLSKIGYKELVSEAERLSAQVQRDFEALRARWEKLSNVFMERYRNMSPDERIDILKDCFEYIPSEHLPNFSVLHSGRIQHKPKDLKDEQELEDHKEPEDTSNAFLWPHINLEDLVQPELLFLFLEGRSKHHPRDFVWLDLMNANIGKDGHENYDVAQYCAVLLLRPNGYGQIVATPDLLPTDTPFHPSVGITLLNLQAYLLNGLRSLTDKVLAKHKLEKKKLRSMKDAPSTSLQEVVDDWLTLDGTSARLAYCHPAGVDFVRLQVLISARRSAALQALLRLREDPKYFLECLQAWISFTHADHNWDAATLPESDLYRLACTKLVAEAYIEALTWDQISYFADNLRSTRVSAAPSAAVTAYDQQAFQELLIYVSTTVERYANHLGVGILASSIFKDMHHLRQDWRRYLNSTQRTLDKVNLDTKAPDAAHRLFSIMKVLCLPDWRKVLGGHNAVMEAQNILNISAQASGYIDECNEERFSDLATAVELQTHLVLDEPCLTLSGQAAAGAQTVVDQLLQGHDGYRQCIETFCSTRSLSPLDPKLQYPDENQRTLDMIPQMQTAEAEIRSFFDVVDAQLGMFPNESNFIFDGYQQSELPPIFKELMQERPACAFPLSLSRRRTYHGSHSKTR